ncbi:uncharacterized protein RCC_08133 [Ramularia collo-cygni]|uniref:Uncharacterized protein n=1 Tax=Ramularia collo-cygni TaxID=112498 RepID=A0A2D3VH33_9PEZI|nr:uncharacterized protein RCC_08133 [Ramularia collo-cygni]CZT22264.1 uncharacterized protein RCC_08133 [Ramularia collo-cygni]
MKISHICLIFVTLRHQTAALPGLDKREADFDSVRLLSRLDRPDIQPKGQETSQTYFPQSPLRAQYDVRFTDHLLDDASHHLNLIALAQSYLISMNDLGIPTWLMHDTLLNWYRAGELGQEQSHVDVMVSPKSMEFLAEFCNMTVYSHRPQHFKKKRNYLLEVSPFYQESRGDEVDARWIDTHTGLYIDVKTYRDHGTTEKSRGTNRLQETVFEGVAARVPRNHVEILIDEYGQEAVSPRQNG